MATKRRELLGLSDSDIDAIGDAAAVPPGCFGKAALDEPLFILRAQDRCAPAAVRDWAHRARGAGTVPAEKVAEAMDIALAMEQWQESTGRAKWPD